MKSTPTFRLPPTHPIPSDTPGDYSFIPQQVVEGVDEHDLAAAVAAGEAEPAAPENLTFKLKSYNGWRISYRSLAPEQKTVAAFRPRLRKNFDVLGKYFSPGSQRSKCRLSLIATSQANRSKLAQKEKARKKVPVTCNVWSELDFGKFGGF